MSISLSPAVKPAVSSSWLNTDTTAAQRGFGPADIGQGGNTSPPAVPTADNPLLPVSTVEVADGGIAPSYTSGAGPWPHVPDYDTPAYVQGPIQRQEGVPQGFFESTLPVPSVKGNWSDVEDLQTYDYVSQNKTSTGFNILIPNNRISQRRNHGQANPANNPTWMGYSENVVRPRYAFRPGDMNANTINTGVPAFNNGELPNWSSTGGTGNTAYETPGPPASTPVSQAQSAGIINPTAGWA